jgi:hypothetical protein
MRSQIFLAMVAAMTFTGTAASAAPAVQDQYCLQGRIWGYPGNCQFSSYQQCMASASGTQAACGLNPQYAYQAQRQRRYR